MIDIYDEVGYIKEVLEHGFSEKWERDATLLVKYYKSQVPPMKKSEVKQIIKRKCEKYVAGYNENTTYKRINKIIDTTWKNWKVDKKDPEKSSKLREIRSVEMSREVLNWFLNLDQYTISEELKQELKLHRDKVSVSTTPININRAKYLFTLYIWTRVQENYLSRPNVHYLKKYQKKFKQDAGLKQSFNMQRERNLLYDLGFIYINHALGIEATFMQGEVFQTPITDENRVVISGEDLYFCGYWLEKQKFGSFICEHCGKETAYKSNKPGAKKRKYCESCSALLRDGTTLGSKETKIAGVCADCGKSVPNVSKYSSKICLCSACKEARRAETQRKYREKQKMEQLENDGNQQVTYT